MTAGPQVALDQLWNLLPGPTTPEANVHFTDAPGLASAFAVDTAASSSVGAALRAARELHLARSTISTVVDSPLLEPEVSSSRVRAAFSGPLRIAGKPLPKWADLSGYYRTADDRAVQFHANFDHHAAGIVARLGCEPDRASVEAATARWNADDLETALIADGMIAAKLRTLGEWDEHPHGQATANLPIVSIEQIGESAPRQHPPGADPCGGLRVLDCSRVLAGPVCGQTLAGLGADVLRVGSPDLPAVPVCVMSTGFGKRNTFADLTTNNGRGVFGDLIDGADIWVDAFRPGALARHGFTPEAAAKRRPGIVIVQLCAFDWIGPWAGRRGFDSIVQSTTGIVDAGARAAGRLMPAEPTPLPVQALDYATGYLAAAAAMRTVQHQSTAGGSWLVRLSLLRTRNWLVGLAPPASFTPATPTIDEDDLTTVDSDFGPLTAARPVFGRTASSPRPLGSSDPVWL